MLVQLSGIHENRLKRSSKKPRKELKRRTHEGDLKELSETHEISSRGVNSKSPAEKMSLIS